MMMHGDDGDDDAGDGDGDDADDADGYGDGDYG